jgi:DNA mismatch repair protein MutS2
MSINEKAITALEFDKIRTILASHCPTAGARELAFKLLPLTHVEQIARQQKKTTDARKLLEAKGMPPFGTVVDINEICERAVRGATLTPRELLDSALLLRSARSLLEYIRSNKTFDTSLDEIFERLIANRAVEDRITRSIVSEDMIADEASSALADIRRKIRVGNQKIKETLAKYISGSYSKYLQENIVTQRGGRYVVPVKIEYRNEVKGLVHDSSSSGATVFIEPMAVVEANNELRMLENKEQLEIERVLSELSASVAGASDALCLNYMNITEIAFCFGAASYSMRLSAVEPIINSRRACNLVNARHPLIDKNTVVPISLSLGYDYDTVVITGPNTGGKTVSIKTLGLLSLMAQAGLHIPADEGSSVCVFESVLVSLGDEQSIEQSLSTFSAQMVNIVSIIKQKSDRSLVLFDELGAGTDPIEGAALAVAIIEDVRSSGALCAATTHYTELKTYAMNTDGVTNASCEFDVETLRPTFKLIVGAPGKSNAFAISQKLGLPESILKRAENYVASDNKQMEKVLGELEIERQNAEKERERAEKMRKEYEKFKSESEAQIRKSQIAAEKALKAAQSKAEAMVESAKRSADYIMEEMDKLRKQKESERIAEELAAARRNIREHLRDNADVFTPTTQEEQEAYVLPRPLKKGDEVIIMSLGKKALVLDLPNKQELVLVQAGVIRTKIRLSDLRLITDAEKKKENAKSNSYRATVSRDFKPEIDLRGKTGEEAWNAIDKYFDEALIAGFHSLRLIHGKGTGALKKYLWVELKRDSRVQSFRIGQFGEGDGGVTVVELK